MDERRRAIRSREEYEDYEAEVMLSRKRLPNLGRAGRKAVEDLIWDLDQLFEQYASRTSNAVIIDADQRAFRSTVEMISERVKSQAHTVMGEITEDSLAESLRDQVHEQGSGTSVLAWLGQMFNRGSKLVPVTWSLPSLLSANREVRGSRGPIARPPTEAPEEAGTADESEFKTEKIQRRTQGLIISVVQSDEEANDYNPLLLHRLCFDKYSFVRTLENFFAVAALVKERKLWIGWNKRGLPVVGSAANRERYIEKHSDDVMGPDPRVDLANPAREKQVSRQQYNLNLNFELYSSMQEVFGDEEPLLIRTDYDENTSSRPSASRSPHSRDPGLPISQSQSSQSSLYEETPLPARPAQLGLDAELDLDARNTSPAVPIEPSGRIEIELLDSDDDLADPVDLEMKPDPVKLEDSRGIPDNSGGLAESRDDSDIEVLYSSGVSESSM